MCEHKRLRCTNCELFCLDCGAKIENAPPVEKPAKKKGGKAK